VVSLKALDPDRPIREADMLPRGTPEGVRLANANARLFVPSPYRARQASTACARKMLALNSPISAVVNSNIQRIHKFLVDRPGTNADCAIVPFKVMEWPAGLGFKLSTAWYLVQPFLSNTSGT
jgi:hypothetical protein